MPTVLGTTVFGQQNIGGTFMTMPTAVLMLFQNPPIAALSLRPVGTLYLVALFVTGESLIIQEVPIRYPGRFYAVNALDPMVLKAFIFDCIRPGIPYNFQF